MKIVNFTIQQLLDSGIHLGHKKYNVNQNIYPYLYGIRNSFCIFNLEQTLFLFKRALRFVTSLTSKRGVILFSCISPIKFLKRFTFFISKKSNQQCYVNSRWEGGVLSNWKKITLNRYDLFMFDEYSKKRYLTKVEKRTYKKIVFFVKSFELRAKKKKYLHFPEAVFLYNPLNTLFAAREVFKIQIPLIGVVDSNTYNVEKYTYPIPGNDDSFSSYKMYSYLVSNAAIKGTLLYRKNTWNKFLVKK